MENDWTKACEMGYRACETDRGLEVWTNHKHEFVKDILYKLNPSYLELLTSLCIDKKTDNKPDDDIVIHFDDFTLTNQGPEHFIMQMFRIALLNKKDNTLSYQRVMQIAYNIGQFTKASEKSIYKDKKLVDMCVKNNLTSMETYLA